MSDAERLPRAAGYRGIWYSNQPSDDQYRYKYSGGLGTYCTSHLPMACYAPPAHKTFFVYGGATGGEKPSLLEMISYYDHATGLVPRPTIILDKGTSDAHHNPTISVDKDGFLWVFISAHGGKDGFIYKSRRPYSIDAFDRIEQHEFTYPQPWYMEGFGFVFLFTKYTAGRELYCRSGGPSTSSGPPQVYPPEAGAGGPSRAESRGGRLPHQRGGLTWSEDRKYVGFGGHYQVSWTHGRKCGTAFNYHPPVGGLNARTNLYYLETSDYGETWQNAAGEQVRTPLDAVENAALVHDYRSEGRLVYVQDLNFDREGNPVILYIVSKGYESGPKNDPRVWTTARWSGERWEIRPMTTSDHNYDVGCLHVEPDGAWRVIAPTEPGPQAYCTGGEVVMWISKDRGQTWRKLRQLTHDSPRNHTYVRRPVNAHPDFYAFWADGDALQPSGSRLYFANQAGEVRVLPDAMKQDFEEPRTLYGAEE